MCVKDAREQFQSTLPVRGATIAAAARRCAPVISIHAPRAGSDLIARAVQLFPSYFNPRSPCGERRGAVWLSMHAPDFNQRSPCGERPCCTTLPARLCLYFNPRSPCGERRMPTQTIRPDPYFNPRSPCGERPSIVFHSESTITISIHAPRAGSDGGQADLDHARRDFNPRSPCGERR